MICLFDMEQCSMINNFKVQNENVKMYIQLEERLNGSKKKTNLYESENFFVRDGLRTVLRLFINIHKPL
jgi:hypothetical protein